VAEKVIKL